MANGDEYKPKNLLSLLPDLAKQEIFDGMGITSAVAQSLRAVAAAVRGGHGVGGGSEPELVGYHAAGACSMGGIWTGGAHRPTAAAAGKRPNGLSGDVKRLIFGRAASLRLGPAGQC